MIAPLYMSPTTAELINHDNQYRLGGMIWASVQRRDHAPRAAGHTVAEHDRSEIRPMAITERQRPRCGRKQRSHHNDGIGDAAADRPKKVFRGSSTPPPCPTVEISPMR